MPLWLAILLSVIAGYIVVGLILWAITRREEMVFFWLPVLVTVLFLIEGDMMQNRNGNGQGPAGAGPRTGKGRGNCPKPKKG